MHLEQQQAIRFGGTIYCESFVEGKQAWRSEDSYMYSSIQGCAAYAAAKLLQQ